MPTFEGLLRERSTGSINDNYIWIQQPPYLGNIAKYTRTHELYKTVFYTHPAPRQPAFITFNLRFFRQLVYTIPPCFLKQRKESCRAGAPSRRRWPLRPVWLYSRRLRNPPRNPATLLRCPILPACKPVIGEFSPRRSIRQRPRSATGAGRRGRFRADPCRFG